MDVGAVPQLAEKLHVTVLLLQFSAFITFFVKVLVERNENISNELNFSDVYQNVNCTGLLGKFT